MIFLDQQVYELARESISVELIQSVEEIPEGSTQSTAKHDEIDLNLNVPTNNNAAEPYSWNLNIGYGNNYKLCLLSLSFHKYFRNKII